MLALQKPKIVAPDHPKSFGSDSFEVVASLHKSRKGDFFLAVPLSMLWKHSNFVAHLVERYGKPRIFFVQLDADCNTLIEKQMQQPWKALVDRTFVFEEWHEVARIVNAWACETESETIAAACVEGDKLVIRDCKLQRFEARFNQLKSLSLVAENKRNKFKIGEWGEHLYWPDYDLHVDILDAIRYRTDKKYKSKKDIESLGYCEEYGRAIRVVRMEHNLAREDIQNFVHISAKTIQRIESGEAELSLRTLEALAKAHGMDTKKYLNLLANTIQALKT